MQFAGAVLQGSHPAPGASGLASAPHKNRQRGPQREGCWHFLEPLLHADLRRPDRRRD